MAALEDEIAAALQQVGAKSGANVPELLETIMSAMASGEAVGQQPGTRDGTTAVSPFCGQSC